MQMSEIIIDDYNIDVVRQMLRFNDGLPVVCGYARVSIQRQADLGNSPKTQVRQIRNECRRRFMGGYHLVIVNDLGYSGGLPFSHQSCPFASHRPGLSFLVKMIESRLIGFVVTLDCSRLCRDFIVWMRLKREFLEAYDTVFVSVLEQIDTLDPERECELDEYMLRAAEELKQIARRNKRASNDRAAGGYYIGDVPFGWRWEKCRTNRNDQRRNIEPIEEHIPFVRKAVHLCLSGRSGKWIAKEFNRLGAPTARDAPIWTGDRIINVLRSPLHCGYLETPERNLARGAHYDLKVIEKSEFDAVQKQLEHISRLGWYESTLEDRIYGDLPVCGICGGKMGYLRSPMRDTQQRCCYGNKKNSKHKHFSTMSSNLYSLIHKAVMDLASSCKFAEASDSYLQRMLDSEFCELERKRKQILIRMESDKKKFVKQARLFIRNRRDFTDVAQESHQQRQSLETELGEVNKQLSRKEARKEELAAAASYLRDFSGLWNTLDLEQKRKVVSSLVLDVILRPEGNNVVASLRLVTGEWVVQRLYSQRSTQRSSGLDAMTVAELFTAYHLLCGKSLEDIAAIRGVTKSAMSRIICNLRRRAGIDDIPKILKLAAPIVELRKSEIEQCKPVRKNDVTLDCPTHRNVILLLAAGYMARDVSEMTGVEQRDILRIRNSLKSQLGAHSAEDVVRNAVKLGLISDPEKQEPPEDEDMDIIQKLALETGYAEVASQHGLSVKELLEKLNSICAKYCVVKPYQLFELARSRGWI